MNEVDLGRYELITATQWRNADGEQLAVTASGRRIILPAKALGAELRHAQLGQRLHSVEAAGRIVPPGRSAGPTPGTNASRQSSWLRCVAFLAGAFATVFLAASAVLEAAALPVVAFFAAARGTFLAPET